MDFHDTFWPFYYPEKWIMSDKRSCHELYMLCAFLLHNEQYEVLFINDLANKRLKIRRAPDYPLIALNGGVGLGLRKS